MKLELVKLSIEMEEVILEFVINLRNIRKIQLMVLVG